MTEHNSEKAALIAQMMREYGQAVRGDWSDIDGRSVLGVMDNFARALEDPEHNADWDAARWRADNGICPSGDGHWTRHCQPIKTVGEGEDSYAYGCGNEPTRW